MTRAKDQLALIVPHRFYVHGKSRIGDQYLYASRSRFIPAGIIGEFETCVWPPMVRTDHAYRSHHWFLRSGWRALLARLGWGA